MKVAIVGAFTGSHVGKSFARASESLGIETICFDTAETMNGNRILRVMRWRLCDRRPLYLERFADRVLKDCSAFQPDVLLATGGAPLTDSTLRSLCKRGIFCVNYSTDDPWNRALRARWHLRALPRYDVIFTTRRANIDDLRRLGCADVRFLPFGYDETLIASHCEIRDVPVCDVLFVGGADKDRAVFMSEVARAGVPITLVGGLWERFENVSSYSLGQRSPAIVGALTAAAHVNLCLVRRANRDGHVMRSFEIAAIGGCMLVEDTDEHREIFGADRECVAYFRTPAEAATRALSLLSDPDERTRLSQAVRARIVGGKHTYRDRFATIVEAVLEYSIGNKVREMRGADGC